jgi:hypothetical protein
LQFLGYTKKFHNLFTLFTEVPVDSESRLCIYTRHLKIVLCVEKRLIGRRIKKEV